MTAAEVHKIVLMINDIGKESILEGTNEVQEGMLLSFLGMVSCRVGRKLLEESNGRTTEQTR